MAEIRTGGMNTGKSFSYLVAGIFLVWSVCLQSAEKSGASSQAQTQKSALDRFSPEQRQQLLKGDAVFESKLISGPDSPTQGIGAASVLINAPIDQCFKMFLNFEKQSQYFPRITVSKVLSSSGNRVRIYKEMDYGIMAFKYTHFLIVDPADHRVDFVTDPDGVNDVKYSQGYFKFEKVDETRTLFSYGMVKFDAGIKIPGFILDYISSKDLRVMALNLKKWIESQGKWEK